MVNKKHIFESIHIVLIYVTSLAEEWDTDFNTSLTQWINTERFDTFVKVTRSNIHHMMETNKYLVLAIVEENKIEKLPPHHSEFVLII